jgi:transposase
VEEVTRGAGRAGRGGWPRPISARRRWWSGCGCRTMPSRAGAANRCAASPPRPGRCRGLADWRYGLGVTRVVMESTSTYWKPPVYLLEEQGECWLVNAHQVKHVPGRPKTDQAGRRLAGQAGRAGRAPGPSFVPPPWQPGVAGSPPATGAPSSTSGPTRSSAWRSRGRTPRSNCQSSPPTCSGCRVGRCWPRSSPGSATRSPRAAGTGKDALQDRRLGRGAHRALPRPPWLPAPNDVRPHRRARRPDRPAGPAGSTELLAPFAHQVAQPGEIPGVGRSAHKRSSPRSAPRWPLPQRRTPGVVGQPRAHDQGRSRQDPSPAPTGNANPWIAWIGATIGEAAMGAARTTTFPWAPATGGS